MKMEPHKTKNSKTVSETKRLCRSVDEPRSPNLPEPVPETVQWLDAVDRRSFLRAAGFALSGALATGCQRSPVEKAIPFLVQPEEVVPGRSLWYATTCGGCTAGCGALIKCRDGRPIKAEGNPEHPLSRGGLCAVGQAAVLGLYDSQRLSTPQLANQPVSWEAIDQKMRQGLDSIAALGGRVRLLTETVNSPTELAWIERFIANFTDARHVTYDPLSRSAIPEAHRQTHGTAVLPRYFFDRAEVIVSFDADFLGPWISPVEHTAGYRAGRSLEGDPPRLSYHAQLEGRVSLTGSNADRRIVMQPHEIGPLLAQLASLLAGRAGVALDESLAELSSGPSEVSSTEIEDLAERLWHARGRSLVVCGSQQIHHQLWTNLINHLLGNYGSTLDVKQPSKQRQGHDRLLADLLKEITAGAVDALLIRGVNPVFDLPQGTRIAEALSKIPLVVSFASYRDETAAQAMVVCPEHHALENWRDGEPVAGLFNLSQPAIRPLAETRAFVESLSAWLGEPTTALRLIQDTWREKIYPRHRDGAVTTFERFWDQAVHDGFVEVESPGTPSAALDLATTGQAIGRAMATEAPLAAVAPAFDLVLYPKVAILDGRHADNPFLQELPDPITKVVWDNYASLSPRAAQDLRVEQGDVVRLRPNSADDPAPALDLPVVIQPGQHDRVVAVALGYGRESTSRFTDLGPRWFQGRRTVAAGDTVGRNAAPLGLIADQQRLTYRPGVRVEPTGAKHAIATTQAYHRLEVPTALAPASGKPRPIIQETILPAYTADPGAGAPHAHHVDGNLWSEHAYEGPHWGMTIDLNACTGCSACVIACQVENNVPVVGKDEVARRRDMHWLRIDRYYMGDENGDEIDVAHQPMTCHHCDNAPCETVCPVLATVHSEEGLNQQVYNRCVGTRYCANNCPFKVRRFNWFDYPHEDRLQNLALNPDVVIRSRGVMEKCSFCVQRIQEAKHEARRQNRDLKDGDVQAACQQSCPAQAITFGDLSDPASQVSKQAAKPRQYRLFEELNIKPSVGYLRRVRHRQEEEEPHHG